MTSGEHKDLNIARILWEAVQRCGGWASTDQVGDEVRKVIPFYSNKCCADVLRNLKQRGLVAHMAAKPGANTANMKGCSRWSVDTGQAAPEWRLPGGKRAVKNHGTRIRESDRPKPGRGKIALEEVWPVVVKIPPAKAKPRIYYGFTRDD